MTASRPLPLVLIDHSEQVTLSPTTLEGGRLVRLPTERTELKTGDYSLPGLESMVAVETKRADFLSTLFGNSETSVGEARNNQDRFREELQRMRSFGFAAVVIERHSRDIWREAREPRRRFDPASAWGLFVSLSVDYGIPIYWIDDRPTAEIVVGSWLTRIWRQHVGHDRALKKAAARGMSDRLPWLREAPTEAALEASARAALAMQQRAQAQAEEPPPRFAHAGGMPASTTKAQEMRQRARRAGR